MASTNSPTEFKKMTDEYAPEFTVPPGNALREEMRAHRLSVRNFSMRAGIPEETVRGILCSRLPLTRPIAEKIARVLTRPSADFWMRMENGFQDGARQGKTIVNAAYWRGLRKEGFPLDPPVRRQKAAAA